jgi:hypothetical protein
MYADRRRVDAAGRVSELAGVRQPEAVDRLLQGRRRDAGGERHHRRQRGGVGGTFRASRTGYVAAFPCTCIEFFLSPTFLSWICLEHVAMTPVSSCC